VAYVVAVAYYDFSSAKPAVKSSYDFTFGSYPNAVIGPINVGDNVTIRSVNDSNKYMFGYVDHSVGTTSTTIVYTIRIDGLSIDIANASSISDTYWSIDTTFSVDSALPSDESLSVTNADASITVHPKIYFQPNLIMQKSAKFETDPYFIVAGYPIAASSFGVNIYSTASLNAPTKLVNVFKYSDVNTLANDRWIPILAQFDKTVTNNVTKIKKWFPWKSNGSQGALVASADNPTLVNDVQINNGTGIQNTQTNEHTIKFSNGQYLVTTSQPLVPGSNNSSTFFTMMSVVFLQPPTKSTWYTVMGAGGTKYTSKDPLINVKYYKNSVLRLCLGRTIISEIRIDASRFNSFKPIIIAVSVSATDGVAQFAVLDSQLHYEKVSLPYKHPFDANFYLGGAPVSDLNIGANMYVLEHNQYYDQLSQEDLSDRMLLLNRIYGVTL